MINFEYNSDLFFVSIIDFKKVNLYWIIKNYPTFKCLHYVTDQVAMIVGNLLKTLWQGKIFKPKLKLKCFDSKISTTVWKVSKYGVFSSPYFPAFGLNTERYKVPLRIQSECGKIRTRKNSVYGHFSRSVPHHNYQLQTFPWQIRNSMPFPIVIL